MIRGVRAKGGVVFLACRGGDARHIRDRGSQSGRRECVTTDNLSRRLTERRAQDKNLCCRVFLASSSTFSSRTCGSSAS